MKFYLSKVDWNYVPEDTHWLYLTDEDWNHIALVEISRRLARLERCEVSLMSFVHLEKMPVRARFENMTARQIWFRG